VIFQELTPNSPQNIACRVFEKALTDIDNYLRNKRKKGKLKNTGKT